MAKLNPFVSYAHSIPFVPIVAITPFSTTDYPNKLAAVLFTQGCPFHCAYCHNGSIAWENTLPKDEDYLHRFLYRHEGFLEGIVLSGGEPTQHQGLKNLLRWIRGFNYQIALHTNGYYPEALQELITASLVDYIAMDVKTLPENYKALTGVSDSAEKIEQSIKLIINSGVDYEFRTTYHPSIIKLQELDSLIEYIHDQGANTYYLQRFQPTGVKDIYLSKNGQNIQIPSNACTYGAGLFKTFGIR